MTFFYNCLFTILFQSLHLPQMQERFQMHRQRGFNKSLCNSEAVLEWGRKQALDHWEGQKRVKSLSKGQGSVWGAGSSPEGKGGAQPLVRQPLCPGSAPQGSTAADCHPLQRIFNVLPKTAVPEAECLHRAVNESQGGAGNQPAEHTKCCVPLQSSTGHSTFSPLLRNQLTKGGIISLWCWTPGSAPAEVMLRFFLSSTDVKSAQSLSFLTDILYLVPGWLKDSLIIICTQVNGSCTKKESSCLSWWKKWARIN